MKTTQIEYFNFFVKWLRYQFPRKENTENNKRIIENVSKIVTDDVIANERGDRDCWTMYDMANKLGK